MRAPILIGALLTAAIGTFLRAQAQVPAAPAISFTKDIQPLLESTCLTCHGDSVQLSKLDLRTRESALKGGAHGPAIVPGNAEQSPVYRRVAGLETPAMPMQAPRLTAEQVSALKAWIDQGAAWDPAESAAGPKGPALPAQNAALAALENRVITPAERDYWAFKLPVQAAVPNSGPNPIDAFLEQARQKHGLIAAPRADRLTLVRRAYLDLIGLPPTPAEVKAFMADTTPGAWDRLIDTLLASPHYGERYGRHWLDVARYADSGGYEYDTNRPNAWRYRDYVVRSFNDDKPYNVFLKEQIAGDEVEWKSDDTLIATGFLRAGPRVKFREKDNPERRFDYLDEIIGTIGKGTMGLTVNCARCHNHKFDPIAQKDYYALEASLFGYVETEVPLAPRAEAEAYTRKNDDITAKQQALKNAIAQIDRPYRTRLELAQIKKQFPDNVWRAIEKPEEQRTAGEKLLAEQVIHAVTVRPADIQALMTPAELARRKTLSDQVAALEKQRPAPLPMAEIVTDGDWRFTPMGEGDDTISCPKCRITPATGSFLHTGPGRYEPPPSYFLIRGDVESHGSQMKPGFIQVATIGNPPTEMPPADGHTSGRRRALAEWIASPQNPLTARVIVNRIWQKHFGRGIVATLENFGKMGEPPTHQELLDWMAVEFMNRGWSIKQLNRLIMTSQAYQMASAYENPSDAQNDPDDKYLWRFRQQRLDAEIVRDSLLAVGGNLNPAIGGPAVFPFMPKELLGSQFRGTWKNMPDGPEVWRRSVYVYQRRSLPYPMFDTFDHPDMNVTAGARNVSTVPTQALTLLNNPFVLSQAQRMADRVSLEARDPSSQVRLAYEIALARPPTEDETKVGLDLISRYSLVDLTHVIVNLNEFLYLR
jgi:hypothetical protein